MKLTTPKEMKFDIQASINDALYRFEQAFSEQKVGQITYKLIIKKSYNDQVCREVEKRYRKVGWEDVVCESFTHDKLVKPDYNPEGKTYLTLKSPQQK